VLTRILRPAPGLGLRILPTALYAGRARTLVHRSVLVNRRAWTNLVSGFFEPVFFLFALGAGFGRLVADIVGPGGTPIAYVSFVAPALLAASAMNGAVYDSTSNVFHKLKYTRLYDAVLATPLGPIDVAIGEIGWALLRGGLYSGAFLLVMLIGGHVFSLWALLALPAALLIALGFAAIGMFATTYMRSWQDFDLVQLVILPMFFFSATFYPLSVYPEWLQAIVRCVPLYHAVELMRALVLGYVGWGTLGHALFFVGMTIVGGVGVSRRLSALLLK
jgi:lipooligosaccharide transport system permease protein